MYLSPIFSLKRCQHSTEFPTSRKCNGGSSRMRTPRRGALGPRKGESLIGSGWVQCRRSGRVTEGSHARIPRGNTWPFLPGVLVCDESGDRACCVTSMRCRHCRSPPYDRRHLFCDCSLQTCDVRVARRELRTSPTTQRCRRAVRALVIVRVSS